MIFSYSYFHDSCLGTICIWDIWLKTILHSELCLQHYVVEKISTHWIPPTCTAAPKFTSLNAFTQYQRMASFHSTASRKHSNWRKGIRSKFKTFVENECYARKYSWMLKHFVPNLSLYFFWWIFEVLSYILYSDRQKILSPILKT